MEKFENAPIIDPTNYDVNDYQVDQTVRYKDGENLLNAVISDIDYETGAMAVDFVDDDKEDEVLTFESFLD